MLSPPPKFGETEFGPGAAAQLTPTATTSAAPESCHRPQPVSAGRVAVSVSVLRIRILLLGNTHRLICRRHEQGSWTR
jgi:hypothetical protein